MTLDILVNNLGLDSVGLVTDALEADWNRCFNINLRSVFLASKFCIPVMAAQKSGAVINMSSLAGQRAGRTAAYAASKAAVEALTFDMAAAYGEQGESIFPHGYGRV